MATFASTSVMDTLMWTFPSMIRYRSRNQLSPATTTDGMSQLSISSLSSPQPTNESMMIRARESPPKGLVEKRRAQFAQVDRAASADESSRTPRSRSVPISAVLLNAQQPQSRISNEGNDSPTRQVQIDMVRYDFRAPADLLRRNPDDPIGSECGEAATTMERLSDGESRMVRVIREIGTDRDRRLTQPISRAAVLAASHSVPRGFPIVTVNVTDPKSTRRRTISEIPQPVVIEVRDDKSPRTTTIPILRSPVTTSPLASTMPRRSCGRAVQIEKYDSRTITIPPPESTRQTETHSSTVQDEEMASTSQFWSPLQHKPRQPPDPGITRWEDIVTENEISIKERELAIAKETIKKLSLDLARLERDKQQLEIETRLQRQKSEAVLASRVADAITQIRSSSTEPDAKLQIEKKRPHPPKFDPVAIKKECERMMEVLRQEGGDQFSEEELAHASEVDREIERLKREVSAKRDSVMRTEQQQKQTSIPPNNSHSAASTSGEEDNGSDSSQIISLRDQVVMYSGSNGTSNNKTALINKLERELTDAQTCNLRLNQKIGALVSSGNATLKKEVLELKKDLKDRTNEIETLKKKLQKAEKDRQQWETQKRQLESKLPIDVQLLMAQKRELTMQLDREQNEKHELFLQINSMIAQLADTQPAGEVEQLKSENKELQRRMEELESSSAKESSRLEADLQKARNENEVAKHQSERERRKMQSEIEETKKELHMKAAALQSLMLATQDANKAERLKEEKEEMAKLLEETEAALAASKRELEAKNEEIVQLRKSSEDSSVSSKQLEDFERKLREAEKVLETEVASKESLMRSCEELIADGKKAEEKISEWETKYDEAQKTIEGLKEDIVRLEKDASEEAAQNRRWEFERDEEMKTLTERLLVLETTLKEKDSKIDSIRVQLLAAESKAEQAEADMKAKEQLVINGERRAQQLQDQLNAKGSVDKEVELLREELKKAEERHGSVLARLQKSEAAALEASQSQKQVVEDLKKKLEEVSESESEAETKMAKLQQELQTSKNELNVTKETVKKFEAELAELQTEKKKLESKASVADELTTLMASLSAVRAENGQFQEEIRLLHNQLEEVKDELERSLEESDEWKARAETAEKEKEMLEAQMSREHEKLVALTSSEASHLAHEAELSSSTSKLQSENTKLQEQTKDLRAELERVQTEQKAAEEESMRKLRELTEKCEAIQKEADTSRSRVGALEEEQNRFRDAADQEKQRLLEVSEKQREKVEELQEEVNELKQKLKHSEEVTAAEMERYNTACARLADVEREYEEMKLTLQNTTGLPQQSSEKLQESESFAVRIKQQLEELEREKATKIQEMAAEHKAHQDRLEKRIEDMEKARLEQIQELERQKHETEEIYRKKLEDAEKKLEDAKESHREQLAQMEVTMREKENAPKKEVERLQKAKEELEAMHTEQLERLNKKIADLEARLTQASKNNAEMVASMQDMSALLETEAKKREELSQERKKWMEQLDEKERQLEEARSSSEGEEKINHLAAENVRLASEVLKAHTQAEKTLQEEKDLISKQFTDKLKAAQSERDKLATDMEALRAKMRVMESRIEDQRSSIEQAEKIRKDEVASVQAELDAVRKEKAKLKEEMENLRSNNNGNPVPPPRRTISNMSTYTYNTQTDFSEIEDVHRLRSEIDKQKRLIIVLRRKLQGLQ